MRISDWSSDVCSSDLDDSPAAARPKVQQRCDHGLVEPRLWARRAVAWRFRCPLWLRREQHGDGSDENEHCHRGEDPEPAAEIGERDGAGACRQNAHPVSELSRRRADALFVVAQDLDALGITEESREGKECGSTCKSRVWP